MKQALVVFGLVAIGGAGLLSVVLPTEARSPQAPPASQAAAAALVGTWRLVEHSNWDPSGKLVQQFGPSPIGYFIHDGTGHFSVQIMRTPAVRPFAAGLDGATVEELRALLRGYYASFGTYRVDTARAEGVYHAEGSTRPELIGTDTRLPYRIEGDSLIIGDGKTARRVWKRVM